jgi:hypothetical protein
MQHLLRVTVSPVAADEVPASAGAVATGRKISWPAWGSSSCRGALEHPLSRRCRPQLRAECHDLKDEDVARVSPLKDRYINFDDGGQ